MHKLKYKILMFYMIMKPRQFINDGYVQNYYSKSHTLRGAFIE